MPCHALFLSQWLGNLARGLHIGFGADGSHDLGPGGAAVSVVGMVGMASAKVVMAALQGRHGSFAHEFKVEQKGL